MQKSRVRLCWGVGGHAVLCGDISSLLFAFKDPRLEEGKGEMQKCAHFSRTLQGPSLTIAGCDALISPWGQGQQ